MDIINSIFSERIIDSLGWTLFHSLWQGILITIAFTILMIFMRKYNSQARYLIGVMSLLLVFFMSIITFTKYYNTRGNIAEKENLQTINSQTSITNKIDTPIIKTNSTENKTKTFASIANYFSSYFLKHLPLIVSLWIGGILFLILKFLGSFLYTQRYRHKMVSKPSKFWNDKLFELKKRINYKKKIIFLTSGLAKVPMVIGFLKPVLLFPAGLLSGMPVQQVETLLAHELAHIIRRDYIINILQAMIDIIYFYHPGVRWISSIVRFERENSCDDLAIEISGDSKGFAKALTEVQSFVFTTPKVAMAITGRNNQLLSRIKRILNKPKNISGFSEGFFAASILGISIFLLIFATNMSASMSEKDSSVNKSSEIKTTSNIEKIKSVPKHIKTSKSKVYNNLKGVCPKKDRVFRIIGALNSNKSNIVHFRLVETKTGKVVWKLKNKKIKNWGPLFRFNDEVFLKKGNYRIEIYRKMKFAIIFKDKKSNESLWANMFYDMKNKKDLTDKMLDQFLVDDLNERYTSILIEKNKREIEESELAIRKAQKEYHEKFLQESEEKKTAERKAAEEEFGKIIKKEKEFQLKSEQVAKEKFEMQLKRREFELQKAEKKNSEREKEIIEAELKIIEIEKLEKEKMEIAIEKEDPLLKEIEERINKELINDKLIKRGEKYSLEISSEKGLLLNGKKLGEKFYIKYKKLYEKYSGKKLLNNRKLILNGKYYRK